MRIDLAVPEMHAAEIRIRATRRLGEILLETERGKGTRGQLA